MLRYSLVEAEEARLSDVITNFKETSDEIRVATPPPALDENGKKTETKEEEEVVDTGPDLVEVKKRVNAMKREYNKAMKAITASGGMQDEKAKKIMVKVSDIFLEFKYAPAFVNQMVGNLREQISRIRTLERQIRDICIRDCKMPKTKFLESFPGNEGDPAWLEKMLKAVSYTHLTLPTTPYV